MQRKFLVLGGGTIVVVVIALTFFAKALVTTSVTISQQVSVPPSYASAVAYGPNSALVAADTQFVAYNYTTGKIQPVSAAAGTGSILSTADTLSATTDKQYILFHNTVNNVDSSVLNTTLQKKGLDTSADYWWVYSVTSKTYQPLPAGTLLAKLQNNRVYALVSDTDGESIKSYALDTLQQQSSVSIVPSTDFLVGGGGYILQDTDSNLYFTKDGIVNRQLSSKATLVAITADNQQLIETQRVGNKVTLLSVALQTGKATTIAPSVTNQPVWQPSGLLLYNSATNGARFYAYDTVTKKTTAWNFNDNVHSGGTAIAILNSTTAVVSDTYGHYFVVSGSPVHSPLP